MTDEQTRYLPMDGADATTTGDDGEAVGPAPEIDADLATGNPRQGDVGEAREGTDEQQVVVDTDIDG